MESLPVQPRDKFVPVILFIVCCTIAVVGITYFYFLSTQNKKFFSAVQVVENAKSTPQVDSESSVMEFVPSSTIKASDFKSISVEDASGLFSLVMENYKLDKIVSTRNPMVSVVGVDDSIDDHDKNITLWVVDKEKKIEYPLKDFSSTGGCSRLEWDYLSKEDLVQARYFESPCEAFENETLYILDPKDAYNEKLKAFRAGNNLSLNINGSIPIDITLSFDKDCAQLDYPVSGHEWKKEELPVINWQGLKVTVPSYSSVIEKTVNFVSSIPISCAVGYGDNKANPIFKSIGYKDGQLLFNFDKYTGRVNLEKLNKIFDGTGNLGISVDGVALK